MFWLPALRASGRLASLAPCLSVLVLAFTACGSDEPAFDGTLRAVEGPFNGQLMLAPNPPVVGDHVATLQLEDETGGPLEAAEVVISPWMPAHGHGSVDVDALEDEAEPGVYVADPLWLNMPGLWELRVHVTSGEAEGRLTVRIEVP